MLESLAYEVYQDHLGVYPQVGAVRVVDIRPLKGWASHSLSVSPYLRSMILSERDVLGVEEFLVKIDLWSRLLKEETARRKKYY